jgi:hypothetical protein
MSVLVHNENGSLGLACPPILKNKGIGLLLSQCCLQLLHSVGLTFSITVAAYVHLPLMLAILSLLCIADTSRACHSIVRASEYRKTTFRQLDLFPSSGEGGGTLLGPSELPGLNRALCFLVFGLPDNRQVQNRSNPECYTPSSEPFRFYNYMLMSNIANIQ